LDLSNSYGFYAKYEKKKKIHHFHKKYYSFSFGIIRLLINQNQSPSLLNTRHNLLSKTIVMPLMQIPRISGRGRIFRSIVHPRNFFILFLLGCLLQARAQQRQVQGVVQDAKTHSPLPLATIHIKAKGTPDATKITDSHGRFSFNAAPGTSLEVTYTGYKSI